MRHRAYHHEGSHAPDSASNRPRTPPLHFRRRLRLRCRAQSTPRDRVRGARGLLPQHRGTRVDQQHGVAADGDAVQLCRRQLRRSVRPAAPSPTSAAAESAASILLPPHHGGRLACCPVRRFDPEALVEGCSTRDTARTCRPTRSRSSAGSSPADSPDVLARYPQSLLHAGVADPRWHCAQHRDAAARDLAADRGAH